VAGTEEDVEENDDEGDDAGVARVPGRDCFRCKGMVFRRPGCLARGAGD
jgi:hypothetical protein